MTLEEAKDLLSNHWLEHLDDSFADLAIEKLLNTIDYYEAKEAELKGALIIPKGVRFVEHGKNKSHYMGDTSLPKYLVNLSSPKGRIYGVGEDYDEALHNALEKIEKGGQGE
jgi:hypothetical protein